MSREVRTTEPYRAALKEDWEAFKKYYEDNDVAGMLPVTMANDTAIHMAVYSGSKKPLEDLLVETWIGEDCMTLTNAYGNTPLHEAAVTGNFEAVQLLLNSQSNPVKVKNTVGETPLFKAAAFGRRRMLKFLASQPGHMDENKKLSRIHCKRHSDNTSILHITVEGEHFETALELLRLDESLTELKDKSGMTCLQLLASMPSAFKSGYRIGILKTFLYLCLPIYEDNDDDQGHWTHLARSINLSIWRLLCLGLPMIKRLVDAKRKHKFALNLATLLIEKDTTWDDLNIISDSSLLFYGTGEVENDEKPKETELEAKSTLANGQGERQSETQNNTETPLLLATKSGIVEIVKEILKRYPQAVEHCAYTGQNILHVAVKHRQKEIFDIVKEMKVPMTRLVRGIDNTGYTILHHAAELNTKGTRPGPALQLQAELKWFKRAKKYIPTYYARHVDRVDKKTAEELFKEKHEDQLKKAQKWIKETSQSCSAVAVLIATVVFAAAYTVPGGSNDKGIPVFLHSSFFLFFTIMDVVSLASSLTSVVMFLSILTSPFEMDDFLHSLPRKLTLGFTLLFFSVSTTMLAFAATIVLIIRLNQKQWTTNLIYVAAFFPVTVFALMQFPLYAAFMGTLKDCFKKVRKFVSRLSCKKKINLDMV